MSSFQELLYRGVTDKPAELREVQPPATSDGEDVLQGGSENEGTRNRYKRAPRELWCDRCRELDARGVVTLLCSVCDVREGPADV